MAWRSIERSSGLFWLHNVLQTNFNSSEEGLVPGW
jgi:hypothetical protein